MSNASMHQGESVEEVQCSIRVVPYIRTYGTAQQHVHTGNYGYTYVVHTLQRETGEHLTSNL